MRFLAFLVFLLFCVYALVARWYFVCEIRQLCSDAVVEDNRLKTLQLTEGNEVLLDGYDQFVFDSSSISPQLNANNEQFLDTVATILRQNPERNLTVTAFYRSNESDITSGFFENIGLARADQIRKLLIKNGADPSRFSLDHGITLSENLVEPLLFDLYDPNADDGTEKVVFTFKNMTFSDISFEYNSDVFTPVQPLLLYADSVKTYMDLNPDANLTIVGHTDSIGSDEYNLDLGMRRARNARLYFLDSLAINAEINVSSLGEELPVAPNSTPDGADNPEGRQKNRRVNFIINSGDQNIPSPQ